MIDNLKDLLAVAIDAAEEASSEIINVYNSGDFQTEYKDDNSPLTMADRKAHERIAAVLKQRSSYPVLSEEGRDISYEERSQWSHFWLVDPLDGTKEFVKRNGEFTVNIALVANHQPVIGVVAVPVKEELYYAAAGAGAFVKHHGTVQSLKKRVPVNLTDAGLRVVASRSHMNEETQQFVNRLEKPTLIAAGSSLKFMAVAKGEADVYPRYIPCMEWDTAAADVIIREVGLSIVDVENQQPLLYNKENLRNPYFICR